MPLQGVTNGCALTQGVASLALGYALVGLSARPCLNPKLKLSYAKIMQTSTMKVYFQIVECSLSYAKV